MFLAVHEDKTFRFFLSVLVKEISWTSVLLSMRVKVSKLQHHFVCCNSERVFNLVCPLSLGGDAC